MSANLHEVMSAMRAAGVPDSQIVDAMMRLTAKDAEKADQRRADDAARKRRKRAASDASANVRRTPADAADTLPPHTPLTHNTPPQKDPLKGVQKAPPEAAQSAFGRIWSKLPPQARRIGEPGGMAAFGRAVARGADPGEIEKAVGPWLAASDGVVERFDRWLDGERWREWLPKSAAGPDVAGEVSLFASTEDDRQRRRRWNRIVGGPCPDEPGCRAPPDILAKHGFNTERASA